jgi:hypothetical protein
MDGQPFFVVHRPVDVVKPVKVKLAHGNEEELLLAERVTVWSNGFSVREIRHLDGSGHRNGVSHDPTASG